MLTFHVLNVGHGSSVVVELQRGQHRAFGLIDSNGRSQAEPRALSKLRSLGADHLSFVCLTHPHSDHFSGLFAVISHYRGKIGNFFSFPMNNILANRPRLKRLATTLRKLCNETDSPTVRGSLTEFIRILQWGDEIGERWVECDGEDNRIVPEGFDEVRVSSVLPPKKAKGSYLHMIDREDPTLLGTLVENELSLAVEFSYKGRKVIFGGDGTIGNWDLRRRRFGPQSELRGEAVNLPHHGSGGDCKPRALEQLFHLHTEHSGSLFAIASADGRSHPDPDVISWLEQQGIAPYCTNLMPICGANVVSLNKRSSLDPELARWVREVSLDVGVVQPCQGDIVIRIDDDGAMNVTPEHAHPCPFRNDYDRLFI